MNELIYHLSPENSDEVVKLHPDGFGEKLRILYKALRAAIVRKAYVLKITSERLEMFRDGTSIGYSNIAYLDSKGSATFRERLHQILENDKVIANYVHIIEETADELICQIDVDS